MSDIDSDEESDDSVVSDDSVEDDSAEAKRRLRRAYRPKQYRSHGVLSKEWIAARDGMKRGDAPGFAKTMAMIRTKKREEALHGSWGGKTLLHHAAYYGCTNCAKLLLLEGAAISRADGKGDLPVKIARIRNHDALALIIEFWDSPTTNHKIEGGPNFDYDPEVTTKHHNEFLLMEKKKIERTNARNKLKEDELAKTGLSLNEAQLAKKLGVIVVQKGPPKKSKQPARSVKRESMGSLENVDDKEGMMSEYQKFRAAEEAAEEEEAAEQAEESQEPLAIADARPSTTSSTIQEEVDGKSYEISLNY